LSNAKGYNRHVVMGSMKLSEILSVGQEAHGLLLLENYWEPWKQLMEYMKQGESTVPSNIYQKSPDFRIRLPLVVLGWMV
jgi:hypothetical protein